MSKKTLIRFSAHILANLPNMAVDAVEAAQGDAVAWMHTGERVVGAIGNITTLCIEQRNMGNLLGELKDAVHEENLKIINHETELLRQECEHLVIIRQSIQREREQLEQHIQQVRLQTQEIREQKIPAEEVGTEVKEQMDHEIQRMEEKAEVDKDMFIQESKLMQSKMAQQVQEKEFLVRVMQNVRENLKIAIEIYEQRLSASNSFQSLKEEERLQFEEQYRMLQWQYMKQIDI